MMSQRSEFMIVPSASEPSPVTTPAEVSGRMVATARLFLSLAALGIILIGPLDSGRLVLELNIALIAYTLFALVVFSLVFARSSVSEKLKNPYWVDVVVYLVLVAASGGVSSIFFFFFYFAILNAAFHDGFRDGLRVAVAATIGFAVVGYLTSGVFELDRFLFRVVGMSTLGYLIASWGGDQVMAMRRLGLLRNVGALFNPRFGVDRTIGNSLRLLRRFFDADGCLMIDLKPAGEQVELRRSIRNSGAFVELEPLEPEISARLLGLPDAAAGFYQEVDLLGMRVRTRARVFDRDTHAATHQAATEGLMTLAKTLGARSLLTVPVLLHAEITGRLIIYSEKPISLSASDIDFLTLILDRITPIIENVRLVDSLASEAADVERRRLARDIHDSTVQQYFGLKLSIDALVAMVDDLPAEDRIKQRALEMQHLAGAGLENLRMYVNALTEGAVTEEGLVQSIARFGQKFTRATGINVYVSADGPVRIPDRLAAELFQIVSEGLSNVRRHTNSEWVRVDLSTNSAYIILQISNAAAPVADDKFVPRSILHRTSSLGGELRIESIDNITRVVVEIPL